VPYRAEHVRNGVEDSGAISRGCTPQRDGDDRYGYAGHYRHGDQGREYIHGKVQGGLLRSGRHGQRLRDPFDESAAQRENVYRSGRARFRNAQAIRAMRWLCDRSGRAG